MFRSAITAAVFLAFALSVASCGPVVVEPTLNELSEEESYDQVASSGLATTSETCHPVGGLVKTFGVAHLHDETLQQQAGPLVYLNLDRKNPVPGTRFTLGTILATITGFREDGSLAVNHHFLLNEGGLRTQDDVVVLAPTDDPCVFDLDAELFIADGSGAFTGASGDGAATGTVDFCTHVGRLVWVAEVCF